MIVNRVCQRLKSGKYQGGGTLTIRSTPTYTPMSTPQVQTKTPDIPDTAQMPEIDLSAIDELEIHSNRARQLKEKAYQLKYDLQKMAREGVDITSDPRAITKAQQLEEIASGTLSKRRYEVEYQDWKKQQDALLGDTETQNEIAYNDEGNVAVKVYQNVNGQRVAAGITYVPPEVAFGYKDGANIAGTEEYVEPLTVAQVMDNLDKSELTLPNNHDKILESTNIATASDAADFINKVTQNMGKFKIDGRLNNANYEHVGELRKEFDKISQLQEESFIESNYSQIKGIVNNFRNNYISRDLDKFFEVKAAESAARAVNRGIKFDEKEGLQIPDEPTKFLMTKKNDQEWKKRARKLKQFYKNKLMFQALTGKLDETADFKPEPIKVNASARSFAGDEQDDITPMFAAIDMLWGTNTDNLGTKEDGEHVGTQEIYWSTIAGKGTPEKYTEGNDGKKFITLQDYPYTKSAFKSKSSNTFLGSGFHVKKEGDKKRVVQKSIDSGQALQQIFVDPTGKERLEYLTLIQSKTGTGLNAYRLPTTEEMKALEGIQQFVRKNAQKYNEKARQLYEQGDLKAAKAVVNEYKTNLFNIKEAAYNKLDADENVSEEVKDAVSKATVRPVYAVDVIVSDEYAETLEDKGLVEGVKNITDFESSYPNYENIDDVENTMGYNPKAATLRTVIDDIAFAGLADERNIEGFRKFYFSEMLQDLDDPRSAIKKQGGTLKTMDFWYE